MKLGILTFHSQLNYGGILQTYALQETLKTLGHDVAVIDRWLTPDNGVLLGIMACKSPMAWIRLVGRGLLGYGDLDDLTRRIKTRKFISRNLTLTPYHFCDWNDAPADLNLDCIIVGSDQVWSTPSLEPSAAYLLEGLKSKVRAISYAASFGPIKTIQKEHEQKYVDGFKRFSAISVRETEGIDVVRKFGNDAVQVVDPVILSNIDIWNRFPAKQPSQRRRLVCYFLSQSYDECLRELERFSKEENAEVFVLAIDQCLELPKQFGEAINITTRAIRRKFSTVHFLKTASPDEFVSIIKSADWFLTDSFHGLAFSSKFNLNVRVLKPKDAFRIGMFSRIGEFVNAYAVGDVLVNNVAEALTSFAHGGKVSFNNRLIQDDATKSLSWLKSAIIGST